MSRLREKSVVRRGFTIVELLMVIGVLSILITIVTTAASSAMRQARVKRTIAMMSILQAGLETYHTQKGEWPGTKLQNWAKSGSSSAASKVTGVGYLSDEDANDSFRELVRESVKVGRSPLVDVSGLFVGDKSVVGNATTQNGKAAQGHEFMEAIYKQRGRDKIKLANMCFGYTTREKGHFRNFVLKYNFKTDAVTVMTQNETDSPHDFGQEMRNDENESNQRLNWNGQEPNITL